jgi:aldehyde dehydrogenase (NAD+)
MNAIEIDEAISVMEHKEIAKKVQGIYTLQAQYFASGATRSIAFRKKQLSLLLHAVRKNEQLVMQALHKDLRKSEFESFGTEIGPVESEIKYALRHIRQWMRPRHNTTPLMFFPSSSKIIPEPLGTVLLIGTWNYPFLLIMRALVNAIAAGNTVILRPSDEAPFVAEVVEKIITDHFNENYIAVLQMSGPMVSTELLEKYHFGHIHFTGSQKIGRIIMEKAAAHLSPVTLELGGKSPCIVEKDADLGFAARKIAWSKTINAGQTCVAPDYVLVHHSVKDALVEKLKKQFREMFGEDPQKSPDYPRLINLKRFHALKKMLDAGKVVYGGEVDEADLYIAPTIMDNIAPKDAVMQEEIFGPILPIISFSGKEEAVEWISQHPYPLSLYLYTKNKEAENFYFERVRFGGGCVNNGIIHLGNPALPFGGTGYSGMGVYHGEHGFKTFTHMKAIMRTPTWFDVPLWYPPYKNNLKWIKAIFRR